jgi:hypothetical protein
MRLPKALIWTLALILLLGAATTLSASAAPLAADAPVVRTLARRSAAPFPKGADIPANIDGRRVQRPEFFLLSFAEESHKAQAGAPGIAAAPAPLPVPQVTSSPIAAANPELGTSFEGLNLFQQRYANQGNQFTVEPPDQGLCVGNGFVLETVNTVLRVFTTGGAPASFATDLNTFYGYPPQFDRTKNLQGPFITDPSCYYDTDTQRWFHVVLTIDVVPETGAFTGGNHLDIAVSQTSSPLGFWNIYSLPVQNNGKDGTPKHKDCPCIGDYPHIGADKYGFYMTTNEYPFTDDPGIFGNNFNGAQLYAFSKKALAEGRASVQVVQFQNLTLPGRVPGFTVWPAQSPNARFATADGGTEYFLSSTAAEEALNERGIDNRIGFWALSNTRTIDSSRPRLKLSRTLIQSETYGVPPPAEQKIGPTPLRDCLLVECLAGIGPSRGEFEGPIDALDSRMQQVWYASGRVWGALDTIVNVDGNVRAGVAFFILDPVEAAARTTNVLVDTVAPEDAASAAANSLSARVVKQGYVAVANHSVMFPSIAVLENGTGIMALNVVGQNYYPSAAYARITTAGVGPLHIAAAGAAPQDGFCEYVFFNCGNTSPVPTIRPRWGDYSAAAVDGSTIWVASEYIAHSCSFTQYMADPTCGRTRTVLGNWSTRISMVTP